MSVKTMRNETDVIAIARRRLSSPKGLTKSKEELIAAVIEYYEGGSSQETIANLFGITQSYVCKILKRCRGIKQIEQTRIKRVERAKQQPRANGKFAAGKKET